MASHKIALAILPIVLIAGGFIYLSLRASKLRNQFYKMTLTTVVVKKSDWQKRSIDFYLDNGTTLNFLAPVNDKLLIGDSIYKQENTFIYDVYRKGSQGEYVLFASYDYNKKY